MPRKISSSSLSYLLLTAFGIFDYCLVISDLGLIPRNNSVGQRIWSGTGLYAFNSAGPLVVTLYITALSKAGKIASSSLPNLVLPNIIIAISGNTQVAFYENQNLSLTRFILFSAAVDIAHNHGVDAKIVWDPTEVNEAGSQYQTLVNAGISVRVDHEPGLALRHDKAAVIGSHNHNRQLQLE